jgi:hypothetical protein
MLSFSLIVATRGRTKELHRFFASLDTGPGAPYCECIVVDQNEDERLVPVLAAWEDRVRPISAWIIAGAQCRHALGDGRGDGLSR